MELHAPSHWRCIDFISDLHLQASEPQTFIAWQHYMQHTVADAVFILGDLFEVWVGDDVLTIPDGFERQCAAVISTTAQRLDVYIMHGNRDFLMGQALMQACSSTLLDDTTLLQFGKKRWLLTHGDALCLADTDYLQFRSMVRTPQWQHDFLSQPLSVRLEQARQMRIQSEARKHTDTVFIDVDEAAANAAIESCNAGYLIHGHTHRPDQHPLGHGRERWVLSDWDCGATPARAEVLRVTPSQDQTGTATMERLSPVQACINGPTPAG
jgi:UDP-2,3-diacylglucosamine hydrolase